MLERLGAAAGDVIDIDQAWTACVVESAPEQSLPILYRTAAEIVAVKVQQIEGEIGEALRPAVGDGVLQVADMGNTSIVGRGDFAIEDGVAAKREQLCERVAKLAEIEKRLKGKRQNDLSSRLRNNGSPL